MMDIYQAILTFLRHEHADVEPVTTRQVADALNISVYSARYRLRQLHQHLLTRGSTARWTLLE